MERSFTDARGTRVHVTVWPAAAPRGVVHVVHGVGEHAGRYEAVARELAAAGFTVVADDHLGHGRTGLGQGRPGARRGGGLGRVGPGGLRATLDAIAATGRMARAEHPGLPFVLLGHSWGSLMAQILFDEHPEGIAAVVLTGTAYRMPGHMGTGRFNRRWSREPGATGLEWLSRDPAVGRAFRADPLTHERSVQQVLGRLQSLRLVGRPRRGLPDVPLLVLVGSEDPVGGGASAHRLARAYRRRGGLGDVTVRVYPGARHEVFNELDGERVRGDLLDWLDARLPRPADQ